MVSVWSQTFPLQYQEAALFFCAFQNAQNVEGNIYLNENNQLCFETSSLYSSSSSSSSLFIPLRSVMSPMFLLHHVWFIRAVSLLSRSLLQREEDEEEEEEEEEEDEARRIKGEPADIQDICHRFPLSLPFPSYNFPFF